MSVYISAQVWANSPLSGDKLLILLALADCANDEGICWPSQISLARRARCSERWARKVIDNLISEKEIEILQGGNGRGNSSRYQLLKYLPLGKKEEQGSPFGQNEKEDLCDIKGDLCDDKGGSVVPPNHKEPSIEPSISPMTGFDEFWKLYPRKEAKQKSIDSWKTKKYAKISNLIIESLSGQLAAGMWSGDLKFVPLPTTFLNGKRWEDETTKMQPSLPKWQENLKNGNHKPW